MGTSHAVGAPNQRGKHPPIPRGVIVPETAKELTQIVAACVAEQLVADALSVEHAADSVGKRANKKPDFPSWGSPVRYNRFGLVPLEDANSGG